MSTILHLASRNLKVYLRDRTAVFFSMLSVFIIIGLYAVFLGKVNVQNVENAVGQGVEGVRWLVDSWIMAGILVVNTITVTLGMFGTMIEDESKKRMNGFLVAPVGRSKLVAGYVVAAVAAGVLLSLIALVLAEVYIVANGGQLLNLIELAKVFGLIIYSTVTSACLVFFLVSWVRSVNGFSTLSTILGTTIGFITGIYMPVGFFPDAIQTVVKIVPATYAAALMRSVMMQQSLDQVFAGAPQEAYDSFTQMFGLRVFFGETEVAQPTMLLIIGGAGVLFLVLSIIRMSRRKIG